MALGRKTGGRQKGVSNKVTAEIKAAFQKHEKALVKALTDFARAVPGENATIRIEYLMLHHLKLTWAGWARGSTTACGKWAMAMPSPR